MNNIFYHIKDYLIYFLTGGIVTVIIVAFEQNGSRILSGFATLMPVFTLVAYFFIGQSKGGGVAVGQHAWFVLIGTIVSWVPYMVVVATFAPRIGANKAIIAGLVVFAIFSITYILFANHYGWFR
jgi:uncharacterized membrane protein (GlpM family)